MRVKYLQCHSGPKGVVAPGTIVDVGEKLGQRLIAAGEAVAVEDSDSSEEISQPPAVETASTRPAKAAKTFKPKPPDPEQPKAASQP